MNTKLIASITVLLAVVTFISGPMIWQAVPEEVPTAMQLPFLILLSIIESLVFGYGVAISYVYASRVAAITDPIKRVHVRRVFIATIWLLVSWWPHDNFHRWNGYSLQGLIYIEYAFHVTLIVAGLIVASYVLKELRSQSQ